MPVGSVDARLHSLVRRLSIACGGSCRRAQLPNCACVGHHTHHLCEVPHSCVREAGYKPAARYMVLDFLSRRAGRGSVTVSAALPLIISAIAGAFAPPSDHLPILCFRAATVMSTQLRQMTLCLSMWRRTLSHARKGEGGRQCMAAELGAPLASGVHG